MSTPLVFTARSPRLALPYLFAAQSQKEATVNEGLALIDALISPAVEEIAASPPASPSEGQCWIIGANPQGSWEGRGDDIAVFTAGTWLFVVGSAQLLARPAIRLTRRVHLTRHTGRRHAHETAQDF